MKKILFLFAIAFIISTFTFPLAANATCTKAGIVVRVTSYADGIGGHWIYMRTSALSSVYYRVYTTDDNMAEIAHNALTSQTRVSIQGSASTCPTTGTSRNMGTLRYIVVNP